MKCGRALYAVYSKELDSDRWVLRASSVTTDRGAIKQHNKVSAADRETYPILAQGKSYNFTCGHSYQTRKISK